MPPASRPGPLHGVGARGGVVGGLIVALIALFQHPEIRIVHRLSDAICHFGGVDIAPQIQIDVSAISRRTIVLKSRLRGSAGIDHILQRRILVFRRGAPNAGDDGNTDTLERFLYLCSKILRVG